MPLPYLCLPGIVLSMHILLALIISFSAFSDQTQFSRYGFARQAFWKKLYSETHESLYCKKTFHGKSGFNIEHVFAASWMKEAIPKCRRKNRKECRRLSPRFNLMESDLHNMYPTITTVNSARGSYVFAELEGEYVKQDCPLEMGDHAVEPPEYAKGKVARAILYMTHEYNIDLDKVTNSPGFEKDLLRWHCTYPPTPTEIIRNDKILKLQRTSNPFVLEQELCS